ncbi:DsrE/DsrF/DrsH-like family protein [Propionivibrio sp.]|uniref:sulfur carrier protein DsrE2 n=1 Tax=Propionivibrio sp. TaxID=2212460 RepID=UPI0025CCFAA5|nr:DsrE/DsrF/DrsH-like family protein [Propionivibrio sp.]MBK7354494.1 DsrE/DsrF/DrsH-like family protein [Propionivibrio sp.]MBK8401863.1 DsrE/DsrF/DrsH-like family protein [Propionivibrio sp.]MBK8745135.1 DsrE/DsrF/DrsH-like family protein [Propionivibrio sp.]MBK8895587.1 DsrE/DsrF/DrsH-like family protein [Propionivibrio sp.]MBL0206798.1 DsrE/DsrF/DrsH-like family protein [Propionivibrio sp.]
MTDIEEVVNRRLEELLPQKIEEALRQREASKTPTLAIIASRGTLDWAYPPFILGSTAAALGWEVAIFFTFYGLNLLKRDVSDLKVSPLGNPGMPMKMPFGPDWFKRINWNIPNLIQAGVPGFETVATLLMQQTIKNNGVATIEALRGMAQEAGVKFTACQMTVDLFGFCHDDFIPGLDYAGAATFLPVAQKADVTLFM